MNNQEFRKLLLTNSAKPSNSDKNGASTPSSSSRPAAALGSRLKSSIPMTPRSVGGKSSNSRVDFAKQLAEQQNKHFDNKTQKKFRTSAPKGSRFAEGYVDRAKQREQEEEDERAERLKALEEAYKKEEIDKETYDRTRSQIAGGDLSSTHLVKGLDFALLRRIKQGEDVWNGKSKEKSPEAKDKESEEEEEEKEEDLDDVFEKLAETEVKTITREKVQKKGQFATTTLNPGQKRSRNQLLAELKAAREAAKAKEESSLGSKFKKIGAKKTPGTRIEKDSMGREIVITVDEDGHETRKMRKVDHKLLEEEQDREAAALASRGVLGMEVPEFYKKQQEAAEEAAKEEEESKEISIFDDVGSDYDPLAALEGSDSSSSDEEEGEAKEDKKATPDSAAMPPPPPPKQFNAGPPEERDYFKNFRGGKTDVLAEEDNTYKPPSLDDPLLQAALKKAKAIGALEKSEEEIKAKEREERLKKKLQESLRDDEDMDMGFGSSRMEDDADLEERKVKLSAWGGDDDADDDDYGGGGGDKKEKRKRGGKKRKGDKNNFEDVMKVIERRKGGS
ncbi:hypothetical protein B0T21DRAFT_350077 [Apiosordaria backusii]|uniref:RED-like N-terminal domain-containing protein n=1 Tax=Apiosordaria backusii TaxID=314023 RepID=A0AA40B7N6_9PEZI|nr:hypothetical protein B0T21DRAFT_350077 [Apiosordaria backusii]